MRKEYLHDTIKKLSEDLQSDLTLVEKKKKVKNFYEENISLEPVEDASEYVGKWLLRSVIFVNIIVVIIIIVFAILDITVHLHNSNNRFIDQSVLGGLVAATIAQGVGLYIAFMRFVKNK